MKLRVSAMAWYLVGLGELYEAEAAAIEGI